MSTWLAIPSARSMAEAEPVLVKWIERGYRIMLWRDPPPDLMAEIDWGRRLGMVISWGQYPGYACTVNFLCKSILERSPEAEWIVTGGDDIEPDPNKTADEIAMECRQYFSAYHNTAVSGNPVSLEYTTFGVMQPTGDRWGENEPWARVQWPAAPAYIDRVCGSPWFGREYCRRMNGGEGPLWPAYSHMFEDEEAQAVALKLGVLWQRRDLTHHHKHWGRDGDASKMPEFLREVNSKAHWDKFKALFEQRRAAGFPGHEPIT